DVTTDRSSPTLWSRAAVSHIGRVQAALDDARSQLERLEQWGCTCAWRLRTGNKLLAAGNGGSAAHAQHLTAELIGRYHAERCPLPAIVLHGDASAMTAIVNDYGADEMFSRQVRGLGVPGDVFIAFSTSGRSTNLVNAAAAARARGLATFAFCGPAPNPLADRCDDVIAVSAADTPTIQEVHQVLLHLLCDAIDHCLSASPGPAQVPSR
ncbi:MAG TPA: SIS domain-containing protein, partial [Acidimicrobiales bacterium]